MLSPACDRENGVPFGDAVLTRTALSEMPLIIGQAGRRPEGYRRQSAFPVVVAVVPTQRLPRHRRSRGGLLRGRLHSGEDMSW